MARWQDAFVLLARRCDFILALPFAQSATEWEILTLRELGLLRKTVFLVPPHRKLKKAGFVLNPATRRTADIFELSAARFAETGLQFSRNFEEGRPVSPERRRQPMPRVGADAHRQLFAG